MQSIANMRDSIFQYTNSIPIKWKVYKVYIAPYIELYCPLVLQNKLWKVSPVHHLQHRTMCKALGIPFTTSRISVEQKMGELSVEEKAIRIAERMIKTLGLKPPRGPLDARTTRSRARDGGQVIVLENKTDREDFIHRLFFFKDLQLTNKRIGKVKFDHKGVKKWARGVNDAIAKKIKQKEVVI